MRNITGQGLGHSPFKLWPW